MNVRFWYSTTIVYFAYRDELSGVNLGRLTLHTADVCFKFGDIFTGWKLIVDAALISLRLIFERRTIFNLVKRSFRLDKFVRLRRVRQKVVNDYSVTG